MKYIKSCLFTLMLMIIALLSALILTLLAPITFILRALLKHDRYSKRRNR